MIDDSSYSKVNYYLRPNKQVERKIMIDILQKCHNEFAISDYCYIGMGSIYYYDFILMHKFLGINDLTSIDNKTTDKRFKFNKPYEFIKFRNTSTSEYLSEHDWKKKKNIIWLDYDDKFISNEFIDTDLSLLCKRCNDKDIVFISINTIPPGFKQRTRYLEENKKYISKEFFNNNYTDPKKFHYLVQNILLNKIKEKNLYNPSKFNKICSFYYKDGTPMYTLGGIFSNDPEFSSRISSYHTNIITDETIIEQIKIPHITYKEKFYLDSKIDSLSNWINQYKTEIENLHLKSDNEKEDKFNQIVIDNMDFELSITEIENYIKNYINIPQYYEGLI